LAELLPEETLSPLGSELTENYEDYRSSRRDWERTYTTGLDLLGFKYENRTEPFQGASGATHPVLAEAVTQFQALAYKELLPAGGPVRTQTIGISTKEKEQQANRVKDFMNYQIMDVMKEYEPEFDQMLFYLPLAGSAFKKVYFDAILGRTVSKFVPAEDLVVPYSATSLEDAESIIHVVKLSENDLRKQQVSGFYRDIPLIPGYDQETDVEKKERELEGRTKTKDDDVFTLLECHVNLDLEGFEDRSPEGETTGIKLPYIVTIELESSEVLSIRRNYLPADPKKARIEYFVHFKFLPGLGFYGFGLIHMIGGLSRTATSALKTIIRCRNFSKLTSRI
jgi:ribosomal protein S30